MENACDRVEVRVSGAGRLIGLDNGDSTDFDSYKGTSRRLFNGKLLAIIQTNVVPGEISVEVTGKGLKSASLICESRGFSGEPLAAREENRKMPVILGRKEEIPVRKITLKSPDGQLFGKDKDTIRVEAFLEPADATDRELLFKAVNDNGVPVNLVELDREDRAVVMKAKGDGAFRLFAMSKRLTAVPGMP